ncbi:MAG: hypothetical protein ACYC58_09270, partial [Pseudomonadaceae bacterium]
MTAQGAAKTCCVANASVFTGARALPAGLPQGYNATVGEMFRLFLSQRGIFTRSSSKSPFSASRWQATQLKRPPT